MFNIILDLQVPEHCLLVPAAMMLWLVEEWGARSLVDTLIRGYDSGISGLCKRSKFKVQCHIVCFAGLLLPMKLHFRGK